jgi:DNA-binding IclR family transcriptional regulator
MRRGSTIARGRPYPGAQAVFRAMAILKAFDDARPSWNLTELARAIGLHKATVSRLLAALDREGMVARDEASNAYRLGPAAIALGALALRSNDLRTAAHAELVTLARESGETASLEVLVDEDVLIVDEVQSRHVIGTTHEIGTRWPAHAASTGKVLLADAWRDGRPPRRGRAAPAKMTPKTIVSASGLARELAKVREQGYATAIEELAAGYVAAGAPVRDHDGRVVAALSVGGPSVRLTAARMPAVIAMVRAAAARVSRRLGCPC